LSAYLLQKVSLNVFAAGTGQECTNQKDAPARQSVLIPLPVPHEAQQMGAHHTACMDVLHWRESYYNPGHPAPSLIARAQ